MKNILFTLLLFFFAFIQPVFSQNDLLDSTFSTVGKLTTSFGTNTTAQVNAMALQPDQKILAVGFAEMGSNADFALARYWPDGSLDVSFGSVGKRLVHFSNAADVGRAVVLQPDGKIVVAGSAITGGNSTFALARLLENGQIDSTFGVNGLRTTAVGLGKSEASAVALQTDGKIVVAGTAYWANAPTKGRFALARYTPLGALDSTFGQGGIVITAIDSVSDQLTAMAVLPNGKIVTAGYTKLGNYLDFALAQYHPDGTLDTLFGNQGKQLTDFFGYDDRSQALTLQQDGKVVVAGNTEIASNGIYSLALARYQANGQLDSTFGINGKVKAQLAFIAIYDGANAVLMQPDGKIIAVGEAYFPSTGYYRFAVARFQKNGTLDPDFNGTGVTTTGFAIFNEEAFAALLQADGKIVAGGKSGNGKFALARYLNGAIVAAPIPSFSGQPVLLYPNPVGAAATVEYTLLQAEPVSIVLYDQSGKVVTHLANRTKQDAGWHHQSFMLPAGLPAGGYLLVLTTPSGRASLKLVK